jgi:hypothetical protein
VICSKDVYNSVSESFSVDAPLGFWAKLTFTSFSGELWVIYVFKYVLPYIKNTKYRDFSHHFIRKLFIPCTERLQKKESYREVSRPFDLRFTMYETQLMCLGFWTGCLKGYPTALKIQAHIPYRPDDNLHARDKQHGRNILHIQSLTVLQHVYPLLWNS